MVDYYLAICTAPNRYSFARPRKEPIVSSHGAYLKFDKGIFHF
jgi:hypothetical protein